MAASWKEDPRLTTALREFGNVSRSYLSASQRKKKKSLTSPMDMTWQELVTILYTGCKQRNSSKQLRSYILELIGQAGEMIGDDEDVDLKEMLATEIFITTVEFEQVEPDHLANIKKVLPAARLEDVREFHEIVKKIKRFVGPGVVEKIVTQVDETRHSMTFGHKIKFSPSVPSVLHCVNWDSDEETSQPGDKFVDSFKKLTNNHTKIVEKPANRKKSSDMFVYSMQWLDKKLQQHFGSSALSPNVIALLQSTTSNDNLQNELFDLLGFDRFDFILELLEHRQDLIKDQKRKDILDSGQRAKAVDKKPTYGCQVVIKTDQEKQLSKAFRKEEKKMARQSGKNDSDGQMDVLDARRLRELRELQLLKASTAPLFSNKVGRDVVQEQYPNVYDSQIGARQSSAFAGGKTMSLPEGFETKSTKEYEEIRIPVKNSNLKFNQALVKIKDLDDVAQEAFRGMTRLNRIQSCVFESAFKTNENLLICAPTGAGKTNVAMLTVVREIKRNIVEGVIQRNNFKIVYVAPMKALAAEMTRNFGGRLESLGIKVRELTGDMQLTKSEIAETQMLVTTPEKWDVVTRKAVGDTALSQLVRLLIIDEVHLLHDERGPVLETLVARTLRQVETQQSMIRIVGLSATLPNYLDVAAFLRVNP